MKKLLIFFLLFSNLFSYSPPSNEKPFLETYKLIETNVRQNVLKFFKAGLYISSQCVRKENKKYYRRKCGAWKPLDVLENGKYRKYFHPNKALPDLRRPKSVSIFICIQSGGFITTEVNEYGKYGRDIEPMDFCQFNDKSMVALDSIARTIEIAPKLDIKMFKKREPGVPNPNL
ncbi:MAG: hypothetical protein KDK36_16975 [Leptospiraceae bacterium]|nr:hypothetical protein [Leptospiraceae bacterium]